MHGTLVVNPFINPIIINHLGRYHNITQIHHAVELLELDLKQQNEIQKMSKRFSPLSETKLCLHLGSTVLHRLLC